jgi:hypothetical protein
MSKRFIKKIIIINEIIKNNENNEKTEIYQTLGFVLSRNYVFYWGKSLIDLNRLIKHKRI